MSIHVTMVDMQFDFCHPSGALYVPGAEKDAERAATFTRRATPVIDDITATMDAHQRLHIAHPEFVVDAHGSHPAPFTGITYEQAKTGEYRAAQPGLQNMWMDYLKQLAANGRYVYTIWPPHCLIGTPGQALMAEVSEALDYWALTRFATIDFLTKGSSWKTEHYSAVKADVPDSDLTTQVNSRWVTKLETFDLTVWMGQASSHCVPNTYRDVADEFADPEAIKRMVLLEDCQSPVTGCERMASDAMSEMEARGMQIMTSTELLKKLGV